MISSTTDLQHLRTGTPRQQLAYHGLSELAILESLRRYDATLVSTICHDIDIESSDLDIICEVHDHAQFIADVKQLFGARFPLTIRSSDRIPPATVIQFFTPDFEIELFGQALSITDNAAYRHFIQTERIIRLGGAEWREAIRDLKRSGMKTEPAIAHLLRLSGDPYQAVLDLESCDDGQLAALMADAGGKPRDLSS